MAGLLRLHERSAVGARADVRGERGAERAGHALADGHAAGLDTLENLARSGRISKAAANIGTLAQLKPLVRIAPETAGSIDVCGKAIGRHRAIDAVARMISQHRLDERYPVIPLYTHSSENCAALIKKLPDEYDVSAERCRADMLPFLEKLLERGLLVEG